MSWLRRRRIDPLRATLADIAARPPEMARVYLRGRMLARGAVCFVGVPLLRSGEAVVLLGTDGLPRATVRLVDIAAVERVFWVNPPKRRTPPIGPTVRAGTRHQPGVS